VEVKIGIQQAAREIIVDTADDADAVEKTVADALASESGLISLTDTKGRKVLVPAAKVAYVEIGGGVAGQVGFRS
jgi:hypothetical protein